MDQVHIFTFKAGLLSRVAHDLQLHVDTWGVSVDWTGDEVVAEIDPTAIVVDGAVKGMQLDAGALSRRDRAKIIDSIRDEILETSRHPQIRFSGTIVEQAEHRLEVRGELELRGVRRPLAFVAKRDAGRITARVSLRPSEFGIESFKVVAGAIRLEDRGVVDLVLEEAGRGAVDERAANRRIG
jgi:polyisoprenoid-binding protein YceI